MTCGLIAPQLVNSGSRIATSAGDGATIGRRIRISQPDEEKGKCKGSRLWDPRKDFSQRMPPPTTRSTSNAISFQHEHTGLFQPRPRTHGARLLPREDRRQRDASRLSFDNVTTPSRIVICIALPPVSNSPATIARLVEGTDRPINLFGDILRLIAERRQTPGLRQRRVFDCEVCKRNRRGEVAS